MIDDFFLLILSNCVETTVLVMFTIVLLLALFVMSQQTANLKQLVDFAKYLVAGLPQTRFLKLVYKMEKNETIEQKLVEVCQTCKIPDSNFWLW